MALDKSQLLLTPLHGIYIPVILCIVGTLIISPPMLPVVLALLAGYIGYQFIRVSMQKPELSSDHFQEYELMDMTIVSKNSAIYRFKLYKDYDTLKIPVGQHLACRVVIDGKEYIRYYTPISNQYDEGFFDLLIKVYKDGTVSRYFAGLSKGQTVEFKGPVGRIEYTANMTKNLYMVAGGSGITPMLQVLGAIVTTPEDTTNVKLLYANETENDILLKGELDELAEKYPYFDVTYMLNDPPANWKGLKGIVRPQVLDKFLPAPADDTKVFVCGPTGMKQTVIDFTNGKGWEKAVLKSGQDDQVFCF